MTNAYREPAEREVEPKPGWWEQVRAATVWARSASAARWVAELFWDGWGPRFSLLALVGVAVIVGAVVLLDYAHGPAMTEPEARSAAESWMTAHGLTGTATCGEAESKRWRCDVVTERGPIALVCHGGRCEMAVGQ